MRLTRARFHLDGKTGVAFRFERIAPRADELFGNAWFALFGEDFVQIHQFICQHCPRCELSRIEARVRLALANRD